jgi:hypothetical protein
MNIHDEYQITQHSHASVYITHLSILIAGFLLGLLLAYLASLIPMDFSSELRKAKELGIVSISTLMDYPKSKDIVSALFLITLPFFCAVLSWYLWARNRINILHDVLNPVATNHENSHIIYSFAGLMMIMFILLTFNINIFYLPGYNLVVGSWPFLGEEGAPLAWAQSILSGGAYGKDFYCLYGPLMPYSLAGAMKLFGQTVVVERVLKYIFDLIAFGLIIFFLVKTLRSRYVIALACLLYTLFYMPIVLTSINFTTLRFVLGLLPLLLIHLYGKQEKPRFLVLAGIIAGISILFSQEAGIVALVVCIFILFLEDVILHFNARRFFLRAALLLLGIGIVFLTMISYSAATSGVSMLWDSIYGFPKLKMLGYGSARFPSFNDFISDPFNSIPFVYWMTLYYVGLSVYLFVQLVTKSDDKTLLLKISLLLFGIVLLRIPLGRPTESDAIKIFHPALLLLALQMDALVASMANKNALHLKIAHALFASLVFGTLLIVAIFGADSTIRNDMVLLKWSLENFPKRLTKLSSGVDLPQIDRGGVFYDPETADSIVKIKNFLDAYAQNEKYVYFYPNEAAYYFIFNKQNPTRYAIAYFAATRSQRLELITDLERNKPRYVIYSPNTWRVDDIPESTQVPEVVDYLNQTYGVLSDLGGIIILQRKTT